MRISYSWLQEHLPLRVPAKDLAAHLLQLGFEVSAHERRGPGFSGVVAGEVLDVAKHPNADRLFLCTVFDGTQKVSIICGAKNVAVGQKVPLARLGATLPGGRQIVRANIRGVESQGMICSSAELGLGEDQNGILVMDPKTQVGSDLALALGPSDDVLDVEITPNRPDCLSHLGLARELSAYFHVPLRLRAGPELKVPEGPCLPVEIQAPQACLRYMGRVFTNLKIGPSPAWLAARLESIGLRPINNLVDITNFVLMDIGQPLHAFDMDKLEGGRIVVRFASAGERIKALDEREYGLTAEHLVIADGKKPCAIAGVMGGEESAVTDKTTRAFLESAYFAPPAVRKTSQTLRLRSDSSFRFERGTDIAAVQTGSERAAELILKLCGPNVKVSEAADLGKKQLECSAVVFTPQRINEILGTSIDEESIAKTLKAFSAGFDKHGDTCRFYPPSHRGDLQTPWDLAEEVARMFSYENIKSKVSVVPLRPSRLLPSQITAERCRERLAGYGLLEAYNYDFLSEKLIRQARMDPQGLPRLANPLSEDWTTLRPSLLIGLLQNAAGNLNRGAQGVRLFEIGKAFARSSDGVSERLRLAGVLLGPVAETFWKPSRTPRSDFYDAKGLLQDLLSNVPGLEWAPLKGEAALPSDGLFHPGVSLRLKTPKGVLGTVGTLHPEAARGWELEREGAALFDLDLDLLSELEPGKTRFQPCGLFPSSKRDLSIVLDKKTRWAEVEAQVRGCAIAELRALELVDVFAGQGIPEGKQSLTLRLAFESPERTLTDDEVNAAVLKVLRALKSALGAILRS